MGQANPETSLKELTRLVTDFRNERDWKQFHTIKNMVLALYLEVAEVGEQVQWKSDEEIDEWLPGSRVALGDELSDVLYWVLLLAHDAEIDLELAFRNKMQQNAAKYPAEVVRGKKHKYTFYEQS